MYGIRSILRGEFRRGAVEVRRNYWPYRLTERMTYCARPPIRTIRGVMRLMSNKSICRTEKRTKALRGHRQNRKTMQARGVLGALLIKTLGRN